MMTGAATAAWQWTTKRQIRGEMSTMSCSCRAGAEQEEEETLIMMMIMMLIMMHIYLI